MKKDNKKDLVKKESFFSKKLFSIGKLNITVDTVLSITLLIAFICGIVFSPKRYSISTARYNKGTAEQNSEVVTALGSENTEERFEVYFQWFNVIHELGHGMIFYNGNYDDKVEAHEEQLVNDFAVAYWRYYGEEEKLAMVEDIADYAITHIDGLDENENYMEYAEKHWSEKSFQSFNGYGWFQFNCTKKALENNKSLEEVLSEMGVKDFKIPPAKKQAYKEIDEEVSSEIIDKAVENFRSWNLQYPDAIHRFDNNPNNNYSRPSIKMFGLFEFPDLYTIIKKDIKKHN